MGAVITTLVSVALSIFSAFVDAEFWFKWILSYFYIKLSKRSAKKRFDLYDMMVDHDPYKVNFLPPTEEINLESPLTEDQLINSSDEVFFYGTNSKSESLAVRVSRRPDHESDAWVQLRLSDGRTYEMNETSGFQQSSCDRRVFSCGDLQLHYISPMRRWRIFYNGLMRERSDNDKSSGKMVYIKFAMLWRALSDTFDFATDVSTKDLATGFAKAKWNQFRPPIEKFRSALDIYAQSGVIFGNVTIEGDEGDHYLYMFGERMRILGDTKSSDGMELFQILGRTTADGRCVHLVEASISNVIENLRFGFVIQPTGYMSTLSDASTAFENLSCKGKEKVIETKFHTADDDEVYELKGTLSGEQTFESEKGWIRKMTMGYFDMQLNSLEGKGILIKGKVKTPTKRNTSIPPVYKSCPVVPYVVDFSDLTCQNSEISGGKGSSLGKLTELSKEYQNFVVPNGIVVTTTAYEKFLSNEVSQEIKNLENILYNNIVEDVKDACQRVMEKVIQSTIPDTIHQEVIAHLKKIFPDRKNILQFAVRSSATGEDTEQMSAAGQMETYLGVTGIDEIMSAVKKCWASQFSHIAVQYKRQNGQVLNSPMAVVIQQMVSCDVAGVLFTCDPLTGDPTRVTLTANYGLGESVVSGSEEPDTIELKRLEDNKLVISNKVIGSKKRRIVVKENDEGTNVEDVPEHERTTCCLTDEMALRLGNLAVKLQKSYRSHRDIEWGFWNNNLYIFQSRPVTSGTGENDFEIDHEVDAPLRIENEYFTVCNVGEVMPGATSPLGLDLQLKYGNIVFQRPRSSQWPFGERRNYYPAGMCSMYNHIMFYCIDFFRFSGDDGANDIGTIGLFGRLLDEPEMFQLAKKRFSGKNTKTKITKKDFFNLFIKLLFSVNKTLRKSQKSYASYRIPVEKYKTSQELFDAMMFACTDLSEAFLCHMVCSESSSVWNLIVFALLRSARGEVNSDVYADFAQMLKTCSEVESADVPASLEELSSCISIEIKPEDFKKMSTNEAVNWLQSSTSKSGTKYREFIDKHGHRCLREFDLRSKTWKTDPNSLVQLLQNTVGNVKLDRNENSKSFTDLVSKLNTPLSFIQRLMFRILLPLSRQSVQQRESSKSILIRGVDAWRKGYTALSQMMEQEGRIPDSDLLFFMTLEEIKELLATRSPRIIARASHRRKRHPTLDKYIFPEISKGVPIPINQITHPIVPSADYFMMKGTPVSQGVTTGFVRVAITLEEASFLQPGEILVTYSTDIGWSPYFPFLSGVVTELGGLISHGAVVSREYGLPCIAGLHGATRQFQTGDYVLIDGTKGILQKLPKPESL